MNFTLLRIDLTARTSAREALDPHFLHRYIGGAGLAAGLLASELRPDLDPLDAESPLLFVTGPLTGSHGPAVGRFVICARSPLTGLWGEANIGGAFGPELRAAGVDVLWLSGRSESPIYLSINAEQVRFLDAQALWGRTDTYQVQQAIKDELEDPSVHVCAIGRAGELQVPMACILSDHGRAAGRTGMGAVMGSKRLKAIAVRGSQPLELKTPDAFQALRRQANIEMKDDPVTRILRETGTAGSGDYFDYLGSMPKRYFTSGTFPGAGKVTGGAMKDTILSGISTCHGCVIACGRKVRLADGAERKGPEYETIVGFGPNLEIDDLAAITLLGESCDRSGIDTISASNVIGLAYELFEAGIINAQDTGGLELAWGDAESALRLVEQIGAGEGFGVLLGQGARKFAEAFGVPERAVEVKGLEMAYHDPRALSGMALVYASSPRGACHNKGEYYLVDIGQTVEAIGVELYPRQGGAEKAANVARHQDWRSATDCLVMCIFANQSPQVVLRLLNLATGFDFELQDLLLAGERSWNLKRLINRRLGAGPVADRLPPRLLQPLSDGGAADYAIPFDEMLTAYYQVRGWDPQTGIADSSTLQRLGLQDQV